jgi:oligopeptide transport system ATP-binding protein
MGTLLRVEEVKKYFPISSGFIRKSVVDLKAVDNVSFTVEEGETLGLVGESGCGKTTLGKMLLKLYEPTAGKIFLGDQDVTHLRGFALGRYRKDIQAVFQNPYASLNPRMRIWKLIGEPLITSGWARRKISKKVAELLEMVGLPTNCGFRFPHEMSAGQRQQIAIARALSINPKFIVLDEPTSLLDVSAQASILNLIAQLQSKLKLTYLFISHNLQVVRFVSNRVGVMYCGKLVELADSKILYTAPKHPYTQALLASVPDPDPESTKEDIVLEGDVISPVNPPKGCRFHTRCRERMEICRENEPPLVEIESGHLLACHLLSKLPIRTKAC